MRSFDTDGRLLSRWRVLSGWSCATVAILAFGAMFHLVSTDDAYGDRRNEADGKKKARQLWREGTRVELVGTFHGGGVEAISFRPQKGDQTYRVLENLSLQRVAKVLAVNKRRLWQITAEVTEYENSNFLILRRVVVKGKVNGGENQPTPTAPK